MILALISAGGCIRDDRSNCITPTPTSQSLDLEFSQTINEQGDDEIDNLTSIRIYVFDQSTNRLVRIIEAGPDDIARRFVESRFPDGLYTMVAWASSIRTMSESGFRDAVVSGTNTDNYSSPVQVGVTTLADFRMMLDYETLPAGMYADVIPMVSPMDNLYYSMATDVQVRNDRNQTVGFDFLRDFATFDIIIRGRQNINGNPNQPLNVFATGRNAVYGYDNRIDANTKLARYNPEVGPAGTEPLIMTLKTLRLDVRHVQDMPLMLYVKVPATAPATGETDAAGTPINLTSLVMSLRDAQGNFPYQNQDLVDRKSSFEIEITFSANNTVNISVGGFGIDEIVPNI